MAIYTIKRAPLKPALDGNWDSAAWQAADVLKIDHFHPRSSAHHPQVRAKVLYDADGLYLFFKVKDQYVRSVCTNYQDSVCGDSCVEFFVRPRPDRGYLNFEANCGGTFLLYYIENARRLRRGGFAQFAPVDKAIFDQVKVYHSMPATVDPEIATPVEWCLEYFIPVRLFEQVLGEPLGSLPGQTWCANFYKCADRTSHPHWATWSPIGRVLNFHLPQYFAPLKFEDEGIPSANSANPI